LAYEVVVEQLKNDYSVAVTGAHIDQAAETLIQRRDTHIDSLRERLKEPRVIKVMDAVFSGAEGKVTISSDDRQYCIDLGLVTKKEDQSLRPSNNVVADVSVCQEIDELVCLKIDENPANLPKIG
jgi:hypothetical protein